MSINLNLISCPKCGGKLNETGEGRYSCAFCNREWEKEIDNSFDKILGGVEAAIQAERAADIARLKRALYDETHKEFISSAEVERICKDILNHYDDEDFYARFYLSTCEDKRTAFSEFCEDLDISSHINDIPDMLDYLITGLHEEWISNVSYIIEKAYKGVDTLTYSKYRDRFEAMANEVQNGIYEPTLHRDVFVMYSGKDMDKVLKMVSMLENEYDLSCFVAARNLRHGAGSTDRYKEAIHTAIKNCDVYLLISSNNSRSRQCEVYEEILYIMDNFPSKPRVEYLAEDYKGYGIEEKFKEFFAGLEYCTSYSAAAHRVLDYCDKIKREKSEENNGKKATETTDNTGSVSNASVILAELEQLVKDGYWIKAEIRLKELEDIYAKEEYNEWDIPSEFFWCKIFISYKVKNDMALAMKVGTAELEGDPLLGRMLAGTLGGDKDATRAKKLVSGARNRETVSKGFDAAKDMYEKAKSKSHETQHNKNQNTSHTTEQTSRPSFDETTSNKTDLGLGAANGLIISILDFLEGFGIKIPAKTAPIAQQSDKNRLVTLILAFFLGSLGIHDFYLGNYKFGIIKLVCTLTGFLALVSVVWWFVDLYKIITGSKRDGLGRIV